MSFVHAVTGTTTNYLYDFRQGSTVSYCECVFAERPITTKDKYIEVDTIIDAIGTVDHVDSETNIIIGIHEFLKSFDFAVFSAGNTKVIFSGNLPIAVKTVFHQFCRKK